MRVLGVIFFAVLVLVGCGTDKQTMQLIGEAESVMIEYPDSALNIMRSIDPATIRGDEDMAHYRLAMAEAMYYNRITPSRDSIAEPLFEYYLDSDDHAIRARALYQHALVMQSEGENAKAMYSLMEAEKSLEHADNPRLAGLVHRTKGIIYDLECLFKLSLEEHEMAMLIFERCGLHSHYLYSLNNVATAYSKLRDYDKSIEIFDNLSTLAAEYGDKFLQYVSLIELCYNYIEISDYDNCYNVYNQINSSINRDLWDVDYYCIGAILEAYNGNYTKSHYLLSTAKQHSTETYARLNFSEYLVLLIQGNCAKAFELYRSMIAEQDKAVYNLINSSILQSQVDLLSGQIESAKKLQQKNRTLFWLAAIIVFIIVSILIYIISHRQRKYKQELNQYIDIIADFELVKNSTSHELDSAIERLYRQSLNEINELCEIYYEQNNMPRLAAKIFAQVSSNIERLKNDSERIEELELAVNLSCDDIVRKLREQCPMLGEREMRIALYTYAGFSNRAISLLVGCSSETLPKLKYGIREQIKRSQAVDTEVLIAPLYNKKH